MGFPVRCPPPMPPLPKCDKPVEKFTFGTRDGWGYGLSPEPTYSYRPPAAYQAAASSSDGYGFAAGVLFGSLLD